jgi:hypothetical protein
VDKSWELNQQKRDDKKKRVSHYLVISRYYTVALAAFEKSTYLGFSTYIYVGLPVQTQRQQDK